MKVGLCQVDKERTRMSCAELKELQLMPLQDKIRFSFAHIREWYEKFNGGVYVAFSGGKDSTVLLHLVRQLYPDVKAVFCDTGLEYPEIRAFARYTLNLAEIKPAMNFKTVIERYGYPVISKTTSMGISRYRNTKSKIQRDLRKYGGINPTSGKRQLPSVYKKWHFLIDAPFKISDRCCDILKKQPFHNYEKRTGEKPFIGIMANDSNLRKINYLKTGCNAFDKKRPQSTPLGFWIDKDIWQYIKENNLRYSKIYDIGEERTGCMFCLFGINKPDGLDRFKRMEESHPLHHRICMNRLGLGKVISYIKSNLHNG
jgi:3'-phosphoadenosine 5'-phosphosulfate sulfotransferase (PAPS reductase)/FAD synthetase